MRYGRIRGAGLLAATFAAALALAACAGPTITATPPIPSPPLSPAPTTVAPSASGTATGILVDEALLGVLPPQVAGIALVSDPATAATIAADPNLATSATSMAVALAIGPGASSDQGADDLAIVSVVQLRPDVFSDAFFRSWRDSYDAAACDAAGGVQGNAQADIADHDTFIGTCVQGAFTYHTYLEDQNVLVSITSVGAERLGEQVVAGLGE